MPQKRRHRHEQNDRILLRDCELSVVFVTAFFSMGFIGNMVVPKTIDSYQAAATAGAIMTDSFLLALFAILHGVMPDPGLSACGPGSMIPTSLRGLPRSWDYRIGRGSYYEKRGTIDELCDGSIRHEPGYFICDHSAAREYDPNVQTKGETVLHTSFLLTGLKDSFITPRCRRTMVAFAICCNSATLRNFTLIFSVYLL